MAASQTPVRVPLEFVKGSMRLAQPICDAQGRLLASTGTLLSDSIVRLLRRSAVQSVLVTGAGDLPPWEVVRPLEQDLASLQERIAREAADPAMRELGEAVERHLRLRAQQFEQEDAAMAAADAREPAAR